MATCAPSSGGHDALVGAGDAGVLRWIWRPPRHCGRAGLRWGGRPLRRAAAATHPESWISNGATSST